MGKKKKTAKGSPPTADGGSLKANPFGAALAGLSAPPAPSSPAPSSPEPPPIDSSAADAASTKGDDAPSRVILSYQRKGRGGKEVTLIELRGVPADDLPSWLSRVKKSLGCGGFREGDRLVITGDQRPRLQAYFADLGVKRITSG